MGFFFQAFESEVYVYHCAVKEERHPVYKVLGVLGYAFLPFAACANALSREFAEEYVSQVVVSETRRRK